MQHRGEGRREGGDRGGPSRGRTCQPEPLLAPSSLCRAQGATRPPGRPRCRRLPIPSAARPRSASARRSAARILLARSGSRDLSLSLRTAADGALGTAELRDGKQRGGQQRTSRRFAPFPPSAHRERPPPPRVYIRHRRVRGARPYAKGRRATLFIFEPKNNRAEINTRPGGGGSGTGGGKGNKAGREPCPPGARPVLPTRAWGAGAPLSALSPTRGGRGGTRPLAAGATSPVPPGRLRLRAAQARAQPGSESLRRLVPGYLRPAAASRPVPRERRARRQKGTSGSAGRHRGRSAVLCKGGEICGGRYANYCVCCEVRGKNKGIP